MVGGGWILPIDRPSPDDPKARGDHAKPAGGARDSGDLIVATEDAPAAEDFRPIMATAADERQELGSRIGHVAAEIEPVFKEPED